LRLRELPCALFLSFLFIHCSFAQSPTVGASWRLFSRGANELRFNYSNVNASTHTFLDNFGGAVPLTTLPFPTGITTNNGLLLFYIFSLRDGFIEAGQTVRNVQHQINLVENLSAQKGTHSLKVGVD